MADARSAILTRIREQLGRSGDQNPAAVQSIYAGLPRHYTQAGRLGEPARTRLLLDRLADYDAEVLEAQENTLAHSVAAALARHTESILLVPGDLPTSWLPPGIEILVDPAESAHALPLEIRTRAQAVLTLCAGAIAETGTILLAHQTTPGPAANPLHSPLRSPFNPSPKPSLAPSGQGRRLLTLLPDHHICILRRAQIVETVSEGLALLEAQKDVAITTISGPSATADIEMTRIRGVHGPRRLTVLLLP